MMLYPQIPFLPLNKLTSWSYTPNLKRHLDPIVPDLIPQFGEASSIIWNPRRDDNTFIWNSIMESGNSNIVITNLDSWTIPVQPNNSESSSAAVVRQGNSRQKEPVRMTGLELKDHMHFREIVRKTRMIYYSMHMFFTIKEEEKAAADATEPERKYGRMRKDMRAATLMRTNELWINHDKHIGAIPGVLIGDLFLYRAELCVIGLHGQLRAEIDYLPAGSKSPYKEPVAISVIVSGGYEEDKDIGETIIYTGHGGQGNNSSKQVTDQRLVDGNLALERSMHYGIKVRVIRWMKYAGTTTSYGKVYVYDGLYRISNCWLDVGKSGFGVYKYKLCRLREQPMMGSSLLNEAREIRRKGINFKPMYCLSTDISNKQEIVPVRLFNNIDDNQDPVCFEYLPRTNFPQFVFHQSGDAIGCDCVDVCNDSCYCCMKNGGEFPYNQQGFLIRGKPLIFECGPTCRCPPHCRNRVTQKGLKHKLEVFRSTQKGWGVRSLDIILAGAFICEFTGVVLTREQAQIVTMNGDSLIYPNQFSPRWAEWGNLPKLNSILVHPSIPVLDFSLDVSLIRNVAYYMSRSSSPNVFVQYVLHDHNNKMFPHLMLFAMENIPPMREISLDYV